MECKEKSEEKSIIRESTQKHTNHLFLDIKLTSAEKLRVVTGSATHDEWNDRHPKVRPMMHPGVPTITRSGRLVK